MMFRETCLSVIWSKVELLDVSQVPDHFRELFIHSGYRSPRSSAFQCLRSLFQPTNETLNVWTHLLPGLYFVWRLLDVMETLAWSPASHPYTFPYLLCLATAAVYTLASAAAHMFNTMSDEARHICFFCDYACVSLFGQGTTLACFAYALPATWMEPGDWRGGVFLPLSVLLSVWSVYISCQTRFMTPSLTRKLLRVGAFVLHFIFVNLPVMIRLGDTSTSLHNTTTTSDVAPAGLSPAAKYPQALQLWAMNYVIASISAFLYVSHVPERWFPGRFDIVGHSHQLFHFFGSMGTYCQLAGLSADMNSRKNLLKSLDHWPTPFTTYLCLFSVGVINATIVLHFVSRVLTTSGGGGNRKIKKKSF